MHSSTSRSRSPSTPVVAVPVHFASLEVKGAVCFGGDLSGADPHAVREPVTVDNVLIHPWPEEHTRRRAEPSGRLGDRVRRIGAIGVVDVLHGLGLLGLRGVGLSLRVVALVFNRY